MSDWESEDVEHAAQLLVGDYYGDRPELKLDQIRSAKKKRAAKLCRKLRCNKNSVVLEIGSGMGFTSKHVANTVKQLVCCDISSTFLEIARKECSGIQNIEFVKIDEEPAVFSFPDETFDIVLSDAVFIHLNLYDIYWYFSEFQRLLKKGGEVFINIRNASRVDIDELSQMADFYRQNRDNLKTLLCWNSVRSVETIADKFGFRLRSKGRFGGLYQGKTVNLIFRKR